MDGMTQILRSRLSPGTRLNGIYEVDNLIASGGMGEVYKGHTIQTGDPVAIKVLLPNFAGNDAALGLFRREASALHNLQHEAIVRYYVFTIEPVLRRPYLAMEFVEGRSLAEIVRNEPLPYEAVRSLLKRLATGLHAAHERGITHRDVSSDNIMIPGGDVARAKIIDFGIARSTLLQEHTIIGGGFAGKYNYVSPEQLGLFGGDVRAKSDIYSLGLVLVEALTGQPIDMGGTQAAVLDKRRKVPDLGAIDLRIRPLLEKMLQPDPAARPDSMMQVATWPLPTSHAGDRRASDADNGRAKRSHSSARGRGKWYASAAVLAALMLGGAAAAYLYPRASGPQTRPPATPETATKLPAPAEKKLAAPSDPPAPALTPAQPIVAPPAAAKQPAALDTTALLTPPSSPAPTLTPAQPAVAPPALTPAKPAAPPTAAPKQPGAVDIAALPPSTALGPASQIERYIGQYNGGDCFFITPNAISANAARIDGYGTDQAAFQVLDEAFKRANGFEADIEVRQVTAQQCPALTFLSRMRGERSRALHLQIGETNLKSGEALTGSIEGVGSDSVQLLLVSDEGTVQDLSTFLKPAGDGRTFNLRMQRVGASGAQPQLLLAVASARPLETLRDAKASADQLFPLARVEVSRAGQAAGATMRYFKLDR